MKTLLHIIASPRGEASTSLRVSNVVVEQFRRQHPDGKVDTLDLFAEELPRLTLNAVNGKYRLLSGKDLDDVTREAWKPIEAHISRFKAADVIVITSPMWNFGMPYVLKHYFDVILQPRYLFRYTATGVEGLAGNKKVVVVTARGGDYSPGSGAEAMDLLMPSLKTMLGFIGLNEPVFINVQPTLASAELTEPRLGEALETAKRMMF
ncbi:MAG TPA: NAD(P)H-dependent oxidoreductase [Candidatus Ozemobacteraceae bacterium]